MNQEYDPQNKQMTESTSFSEGDGMDTWNKFIKVVCRGYIALFRGEPTILMQGCISGVLLEGERKVEERVRRGARKAVKLKCEAFK